MIERMTHLKNGAAVWLRPIRPEDAPGLIDLYGRLSSETVYQRFFAPAGSLSWARAYVFATVDYDDRFAIVAERGDAEPPRLIGVARYERAQTAAALGEIALVVEDRWQRLGLGTLLLDEILAEAAAHGIRELRADVLSHNRPMLHLLAQRTEIIRRTTDNGITEIHLRRRAG
ncbi:MAG: GNAT family N-acetyltransferase [Candidatus Rokuibacteriota bacterium]|nr:MAG: GNAT family N-acetyltransferase [Candidatus Rokubacteria bacterium]